MKRDPERPDPPLVRLVRADVWHLGLAGQAAPAGSLCGLTLVDAVVLPFQPLADEAAGPWCPRCLVARRERAAWTCDV